MSKAAGVYNPSSGSVLLHDTFDIDSADITGELPDTIGRGPRAWAVQAGTGTMAKTGDQAVGGHITDYSLTTFDTGDVRPKTVTMVTTIGGDSSRSMIVLRSAGTAINSGGMFLIWIQWKSSEGSLRLTIRKVTGGFGANQLLSTGANTYDYVVADPSAEHTIKAVDDGSIIKLYVDGVFATELAEADTDYPTQTEVGFGSNNTGTTYNSYKCELT